MNSTNSSNLTLNSTNEALVDPFNYVDTLWILMSTVLVWIMLPGLGFYYSGYIRRTNTLTIFLSILVPYSLVTIQWYMIGYSLVFSETGSKMIGNFKYSFLMNIGLAPSVIIGALPSNVFMIYQSLFAGITPCLFYGAIAERGTISGFIIIVFFWSTFVYDFIAYWTWNRNGWLNILGALDFAGGGPVHIASGFSALAYTLVVGPRTNVNFKKLKPINLTEIFLGTCLLWIGWMGFNGGSEGALNARAVNAVVTSILAAATAGISWIVIEMIFHRTWALSLNAYCTGALAGLVSITPGCGFVQPIFAIVIGLITPVFCFSATYLKKLTRYKFDDATDVFAVHGVGGVVGSLLTGIFAQNSAVAMAPNDTPIDGGWLDGNWMQVVYQLAAIAVSAAWAFTITFIFAMIVDYMPFIELRLDEESEKMGSDFTELGENAYGVDLDIEERKRWPFKRNDKVKEIKEPGATQAFDRTE